ncbi:MAG: hypothetical protein P8Y69_00090 [Gammaproteobacteria bacterium]|jgi:hypothetical protein
MRDTLRRASESIGLVLMVMTAAAHAWVYPEHRDLALLAVSKLDADRAQVFEQLWTQARAGHEGRFCSGGADTGQSLTPECIDWAALSAIAGDHSCSSRQMLETVSASDWILVLADVAAQLKVDLGRIPVTVPIEQLALTGDTAEKLQNRFAAESHRADRINALRTADTRMQRVDVEYATRAGANNAHFLLARDRTNQTGLEYADATLLAGAELNAVGVYTWYHLSALQKASRLAREDLSEAERRDLARATLFDEAFALHFLEDVFASGHVAGTWGDASQRKGTHDFYNQNGLESRTWSGGADSVVLMGDAHMRPEDADVAANAVATSLNQVLDTAAGRSGERVPYRGAAHDEPDAFDVCRNETLPEREEGLQVVADEYDAVLGEALRPTPIPGLGPGLGSMPRFRSELGPFIGLAGAIDARGLSGGFESSQHKDGGAISGLELALRGGIGLEGALGESSDGILFSSLGFRSDAASTNRFDDVRRGSSSGNLSAAIPSRSGLVFRLRMPYYVLPADLLLLSPMYFINPDTYTRWAVSAVNGGALGWQQGMATPLGRLQFVLGREVGVTWYGLSGHDQLLAPAADIGGFPRIVNFKSTAYEFPLLEFRPYRSFSSNQSSSIVFQLYGGLDVPRGARVVLPEGEPPVDLDTIWFLGLRMAFDWRYYF